MLTIIITKVTRADAIHLLTWGDFLLWLSLTLQETYQDDKLLKNWIVIILGTSLQNEGSSII